MNDDTDKPLNPVGDAALEARITAWVLGEASPFEAAELEEICARDPEARLFERRLRVLHGFIIADRKAGPDDEWKLPAEKRAKIEALFEQPVVLKEEDCEPEKVGIRYVRKPVPPRQTGRRALLALAACTVISAAGWVLFSSVGESAKDVVAMQEKAEVSALKASWEGRQRGVEELRRAIVAQEDAVEDKRKRLAQIVRTEGIAGEGARGYGPTDNVISSTEAHAQLEQEKAQLEGQIDNLLRYDGAQQMNYASGLVAPDDALAAKVPQLQEAKRDLDALRSQGLAENHPEVSAKAAKVAGMEKDVSESVANVREILKAKLALSNEQLARLDASMASKEDDAVRRGIANQSFADVKNDFESSQRVLDGLKSQLAAEELQMNASDDAMAMASADKRDFLPGGSGGGGAFGGGGAARTPAAPAARPASAPRPAADVDSLAAIEGVAEFKAEHGAVVDESLAKLSEDRQTVRSKSSVAGSPLVKDGERHFQLSQNSPAAKAGLKGESAAAAEPAAPAEVPAPATAPVGAIGGVALYDSAGHEGFGLDAPTARDGKPANMDADAADQFASSFGNAPADAPFDMQARFRRGGVAADGGASVGGRVGGEYAMELGLAGDRLNGGRDNLDATVPPVSGPFVGGLFPTQPQAPAFADVSKGGMEEDLTLQMNGSVDPAAFGRFAAAKKAMEQQQALGTNTSDQSAFMRRSKDEGSKELADAEVTKNKDGSEGASAYFRLDGLADTGTAVSGKPADARTRSFEHGEMGRVSNAEMAPAKQEGKKDLKEREEAERDLSSLAKSAGTPSELLPKLDKAIREGEEQLVRDPNSIEVQAQLQSLAKVRDDLRNKIEADAKGGKMQEQNKPAEPVLPAETVTSAEPFSTFSLHVSDASFKMAKAALDRGEVPAADGIRPEEFYNAFDYGDPAPANGEPVVCAVEQSAHPALPQRNLLRIGVKTGSQGRGGSTPLNLTLLLDSSGSMEREDRNAGLANAVKQLSGLLKEGDTVSVIGFARQPRLLVDRLPGNRAQELNAIFAQTPSEGGTNLEEGIKLGEELAMRQFNPAAQNRIVLFTDGAANLGDAKPETLQAKIEHMRQNGISFDAAGFGTDGLNDKLLERLTRNGNGRYYIVDRAEDADASFAKQLAGAFRPAAENVKVQVRFNPARVAKYKLIGFEEHRLKKEDFRNDAVDAAEMAAEEAGNALYQIEALPQGEGEVGEVSVRFRDAASGQMVERTWTIPYEAQAPSFDQATPSIQLAGLAAFAAEKLRAAPMADAVDFQQLAPVMAKVKARYASSKPVADLESMIGKLK